MALVRVVEKLKRGRLVVTLSLVLALVMLAGMVLGAVDIAPARFGPALVQLMSQPATEWDYETIVIFRLRLPRVILAAMVGAGLATAGAVLQGLLHNGLADSHILGVSAGASLGAASAMLLGLQFSIFGLGAITPMAFIGAVVTLLIVLLLARRVAGRSTLGLLLAGIAMSSFLSALVSLMVYFSGNRIHPLLFWLMGSFAARGWHHVVLAAPYLVAGYMLAFFYHRYLTAISLGDMTAHHLGVNVERVRFLLLCSTALLTAAAVAVSGVIGFVGLMTPHMARLLGGENYRRLLPYSALVGAIFMTTADIASRFILRPTELPVGIITALVGGPFFLYLLARSRKAMI
ncbi:MAG: iron ABC transporter permease [Firmicutes bacterium]|nr:iron ABC transporter permease [Dethiobacter sp.]MBS3889049.1 iron ABC transporter permease [Bacillota bacterium]MBS4053765.1 iron ABC transporter permease [Thermaerobacter sp.]